jgi:KAP family P-loop domain
MKSVANKAIISGVAAFLLFNSINTGWVYYATIFLVAWILVFINFNLYKNYSLYNSLLIINLAIFIVYCIITRIKNGSITQTRLDELCLLIVLGVLFILGYFLLFSLLSRRKNKNTNSILINKREKDLNLLLSYLENFEIIGLNGRWGTGKSFIINTLKERIQDKFEFIEIDLMTCNLNEMQPTLIKAFEEVMYKNKILPKYANKMKNNIESTSFISKIQDLTNLIFINSNSNSEILHEFQNELKKLDKKILVIYEDIDRISNPDVIREIFSISEKISNENIKIIYQYDEFIMEELGFNADYLEKYIPFKINLTELHFWEVLQFELKGIDESILSTKDFNFIRYQDHRFNVLQNFFGFKSEYIINVDYTPIRKVKQMIGELLMTLEMKKDLYTNHKETIISFYILKHLYSEAYKKLDIRESLLEALKFKVDEKKYTIFQLIQLYKENGITSEKLEEIFFDKQNQENYGILKLFKYEIINRENIIDEERLRELEEKTKHDNEKIDRIIWNLLYEGKSIFTDFENAAKKFNDEVLSKPVKEKKEAFQDFWNYFYYSDEIVTDNTTIFKIGSSNFLELFKCFKIANIDNDVQIKLIDFYFEYNNIKEFNLDLVKCMNYSPLKTTEEYLTILNYLNSLQVVGNLGKKEEFTEFLNKYIHALTNLGYIHSYKYFYDFKDFIGNQEYLLRRLGDLLQDFENIKSRHEQVRLNSTIEELDVIILFVQKIIEILKSEEKIRVENRPFINTEITSRKINQEEFDRLKQLIESEADDKIEEIEASYKQKKITLYEVDELLKNKKFRHSG